MNKEQQELLDEAYKNYCKHFMDEYLEKNELGEFYRNSLRPYPIEEFINKIKTDVEFSKTWGLEIEEREFIQVVQTTQGLYIPKQFKKK